MGRKRGGSYCYQPEKLSFLAEAAVDNAMFETTYPPFLWELNIIALFWGKICRIKI
jgi:hypothetical protein